MPFNASQVDGYKKGLSDEQKKKWIAVANGVLKDCKKVSGFDESKCSAKAVRIANSKFELKVPFNPAFPQNKVDFHLHFNRTIEDEPVPVNNIDNDGDDDTVSDPDDIEDAAAAVSNDLWLTPDRAERLEAHIKECVEKGGKEEECFNAIFDKMRRGVAFELEVRKMVESCPDCQDEMASCMEKGMTKKECNDSVYERMRKKMSATYADLTEIPEMEIFRIGTHNGDTFDEKDLEDIVNNFKSLKGELRPKLKITHSEEQESLAGLASYGDITDVFMKKVADGSKRLFAKISRVPQQVYDWIKDGRFSERSIEIYPEFKLGTKDNSPTYKNVLKAIALLGSQMPAVPGMAPVKLAENMECQGTFCVRQKVYTEQISENTNISLKLFEKKLETERLVLSGKP